MAFREHLYTDYYKTQASRHSRIPEAAAIAYAAHVLSKEVLPLLPADKTAAILELGCGHGTLISLLHSEGYSDVGGIDGSAGQIQKAHDLGIADVQCAEITEFLSAGTRTYDVIIGIDLIEHFSKPELLKALERIKECLKDGGQVIFRTPNCDAPFGSTFYLGDFTHEVFLNYFSAEQVMLTTGFRRVKIQGSHVGVRNPVLNLFRAISWRLVVAACRFVLFSSGKSGRKTLFTPNLIISAVRQEERS